MLRGRIAPDRVLDRGLSACGGRTSGPRRIGELPEPGRYLVVCGVVPHFNEGMHGFVNVKGDRSNRASESAARCSRNS